MRPVDSLTDAEAAHILGVNTATLRRHVIAGRLSRGDRNKHRMLSRSAVEALALHTYPPRKHRRDEHSYWVTSQRAAEILRVNVSRLNQLVAKGLLPFEVHADGTRLYRREQLEVVANAREARWH